MSGKVRDLNQSKQKQKEKRSRLKQALEAARAKSLEAAEGSEQGGGPKSGFREKGAP